MAKQLTSSPQAPADEGAPRWQRTLWSVWTANLLANLGFSFCMPFLPFYVRELGVADDRQAAVWAGAAMTSAGLGLTIFSPIWGAVADRIGRKPMLLRAMLGGAVVIAVLGLVQSAPQLVALRLLQGAVTGTGAACASLVASCAPRSRLGYAMGIMQTSVIAGCSVGPWLGGLVADHIGYREPFFLCGALWLVSGLIVVFGVTERFIRPQPGECNGNGLRQAFGGTGTVAVLSMIFLANFSVMFVGPVFPLFVERVATGMRPATATGMLMGISGVAAGIACLLLGHWGQRFSQRRLLVYTSVAAGLLSFPHAVATSIGQLVGLRIGWGLATGGSSPLINSMIGSSVSAASLGRAFGTMSAAQCLGIALGPLAGGFMAAAVGLRLPFVVMGFLLLASGALIAAYVKPAASGPSSGADCPPT
ncbi:MAG TPA: MFS transporter [Armatimonadota bacterium]|nr:MFS transporter [Armatimonadota bacterium]